jgi:hypothetical protein
MRSDFDRDGDGTVSYEEIWRCIREVVPPDWLRVSNTSRSLTAL